jgi:peptidoglycan hydrolase-like protein with peptidoglycan-binding domain
VAAETVEGVEIELVSPESIEAVEQAEAAFAAASDIEDRTPVVEAGVAFSSAAYALEVAWVRLFADAGCLDGDEEAQAEAQQWVADYVSALQTDLRTLGYYQGEIDGIYGAQTVAAVETFQEDSGLPVTGLVDPPTQAAMQAALGGQESAQVGALQAILIAAGYYDGTVDGQWSPEVEAALIAMQRDLGVEPTGVIDAATLRALQEALAAADEDPEMPTTTAPEPTTPTTRPPAPVTTTTAAATTTTAATPPTTAPIEGSVLDILAETGQFTVFLGAVESAGLTEMLSGPGPFTVFAPTDEAFAAVTLPDDPDAMSALVLYHVVEDDLDAFELVTATAVTTAQGSEIAISVVDGAIVLNELSTVTITNIIGGNGRAHVINAVLLPPS